MHVPPRRGSSPGWGWGGGDRGGSGYHVKEKGKGPNGRQTAHSDGTRPHLVPMTRRAFALGTDFLFWPLTEETTQARELQSLRVRLVADHSPSVAAPPPSSHPPGFCPDDRHHRGQGIDSVRALQRRRVQPQLMLCPHLLLSPEALYHGAGHEPPQVGRQLSLPCLGVDRRRHHAGRGRRLWGRFSGGAAGVRNRFGIAHVLQSRTGRTGDARALLQKLLGRPRARPRRRRQRHGLNGCVPRKKGGWQTATA